MFTRRCRRSRRAAPSCRCRCAIYTAQRPADGADRRAASHPDGVRPDPRRHRQAFIAAEDDRFFEHHGFDYQGILRAFVNLVKGLAGAQGAGTITMQRRGTCS